MPPIPLLQNPTILILDAPVASRAPELEVLANNGIQARIVEFEANDKDSEKNRRALAQADFILTGRTDVDEPMLNQAGRCLLVVHYGPGIGPDVARVAMEAARGKGIYVSSIPNYASGDWVRETFRLIECLTLEEGAARPLKGLRLGLVGLGCVGRLVARQGRALGMHLWACDPFVSDELFAQQGVQRADLATLMGIADIVSLHVPLGPMTRGMISADLLLLMKNRSLLISTAAMELVDLDGLTLALERGRPAAAAFDEDLTVPLTKIHSLRRQVRLKYGPRQAGQNLESTTACRREAGQLLLHVLQGNRPGHLLIDPPCPRHILLLANQHWS